MLEARRHYADDLVPIVVDAQLVANRVSASPEAPLPQAVAEDDFLGDAGLVVLFYIVTLIKFGNGMVN